MARCLLAFVLLAALPTAGPAQFQTEPPLLPALEPSRQPAATVPPADGQAASPSPAAKDTTAGSQTSAATEKSGEGITVSMLNETSKLKLFGQFSTLAVYSTVRPFASGEPLFLVPDLVSGFDTDRFDLHARQTAIGAQFTGPEFMGMTPGANFLAFILNDTLVSDNYGFLPVSAYGELKDETWRFMAGLDTDVFNPVSPKMNAIVNLNFAGNTGSYRGQVRLEHFYRPSDYFQFTTRVALSEPVSTIIVDNRRLLEDNGWPNVEGRFAAGFGAVRDLAGGRKARPVEVGVSGLVGELRNSVLFTTPDTPPPEIRSVIQVWGLGADVQAALTDRFGVAGEFFVGQSLGEYSGTIGQSFGRNLRSIRGAGGFGEAYYYLTDRLHLHAGYGIDAPVVRDLTPTQIARNQAYFANLIWDVTKVVQVSFEVNYRETDFVALPDAEGMVFLSQFLWRF